MPIDEVPLGLRPESSWSETELTMAQAKMAMAELVVKFVDLSYEDLEMRLK